MAGYYYAAPILQYFIGKDKCNEQCADLIDTYSTVALTFMIPDALNSCMVTYFQSMTIVWEGLIVSIFFFILAIPANYLLIYTSGLGYIGSPFATSIARWGKMLTFWVYMFAIKKLHKQAWPDCGWSYSN